MRWHFCIHPPESEPPQETQVKLMSMLVTLVVVAVMAMVATMIMMEMMRLYEQEQRKEEVIRVRRGSAVHGKDVKLLHKQLSLYIFCQFETT